MHTNSSLHTKKLVQTAILVAVMLVFNFTPLGFLKVGAIEITFMCIPVAIGAIMMGPVMGGVLGTLFGVLSFVQCFGMSVFGTFLFSLAPVITAILCIVPRFLCGWLTGLLFVVFRRLDRKKLWCYFAASASTALLNTLFFVTGILLGFWQNETFLSTMQSSGLPVDSVFLFFAAFVGVNGLVEAIVNCVVGGGIAKALARYVMRNEDVEFSPATPVVVADPATEQTED